MALDQIATALYRNLQHDCNLKHHLSQKPKPGFPVHAHTPWATRRSRKS
jgi:hypothetical protein